MKALNKGFNLFSVVWQGPCSLILMPLLAAFLLFANLDNVYLWSDEAEVALIAQNVLSYGYPKAWDGKEIIAPLNGYAMNDQFVWTTHAWLQFYITALSFLILGVSTFSARFPFALIGLFSIIISYPCFSKIAGDKETGKISTLLLTLSVPFLLYARQCRWYAPLIPATMLILYFYLEFLNRRNRSSLVGFVICSILMFHTNYVSFFSFMTGIAVHFILFEFNKERLKQLIPALFDHDSDSNYAMVFLYSFWYGRLA